MGIKLGQDIIDTIRGKKKSKITPPSVKNNSFEEKMKACLRTCASYHYPETKEDYIPDFTKPIFIEQNKARVEFDYKKALAQIKNLDINKLSWTYENLEDEYSKDIMIKALAYNCFETPRLRFPIFYSPHLQMYDTVNSCAVDNEEIELWNGFIKLKKHNLSKIGYNITLWQNAGGTIIDFIEEQYRYRNIVVPQNGDSVIDAGACYGDTALYFSEKTNGGKVYSFEFLPENVDIFNKNIELNPKYRDNIQLIQKPVSNISGEKLYCVPNGPGTCVTSYKQANALEYETITIDDFVEQNSIEKIDFIKMDIEGSEEAALKGAIKTITKHKPKLAICAYHKPDDLCVLPQLIKSMVPEYKLYLDHFTMNFTETVLYARV